MSSEMRECPFCGNQPRSGWQGTGVPGMDDCGYWGIDCCNAFAHADTEAEALAQWNRRALLARTEAGADGVSIWRYRFRNSETGGWHEWRYSEQEPVLNSFVADKTEIQGPFTHPQDASGDAEDARRYRWLKDRSTRKSVMDSAKQNGPFIAIGSPLSGFHVPLDIDSDVDAAMQAKEAK